MQSDSYWDLIQKHGGKNRWFLKHFCFCLVSTTRESNKTPVCVREKRERECGERRIRHYWSLVATGVPLLYVRTSQGGLLLLRYPPLSLYIHKILTYTTQCPKVVSVSQVFRLNSRCLQLNRPINSTWYDNNNFCKSPNSLKRMRNSRAHVSGADPGFVFLIIIKVK